MMIHDSNNISNICEDQACLELQSSDPIIIENQNYDFSELEESSASMLFKDLNWDKIQNVEPTEKEETNEIKNTKINMMTASDQKR